MISKNKIERICRSAGMRPVKRGNIEGAEVFIADGFSLMPHRPFQRFGVEPTEFPAGMYCTLWWVSRGEDKLDIGQPLFFDAFHDRDYSRDDKQRARINAAMKEAGDFLAHRKKKRQH